VTYVDTFQAINATIRNPYFAIVFFGSLPALVAVSVLNRTSAPQARSFAWAALCNCYVPWGRNNWRTLSGGAFVDVWGEGGGVDA